MCSQDMFKWIHLLRLCFCDDLTFRGGSINETLCLNWIKFSSCGVSFHPQQTTTVLTISFTIYTIKRPSNLHIFIRLDLQGWSHRFTPTPVLKRWPAAVIARCCVYIYSWNGAPPFHPHTHLSPIPLPAQGEKASPSTIPSNLKLQSLISPSPHEENQRLLVLYRYLIPHPPEWMTDVSCIRFHQNVCALSHILYWLLLVQTVPRVWYT